MRLAALLIWLFLCARAAAVIAFVADGTLGEGVTTAALPKPAGTASGTLLIACVDDGNTGTAALTPPSGWTLVTQTGPSVAGPVWLYIYTRLAGGSEPSTYTFSDAGASFIGGNIRAYSGTAQSSPFVNSFAAISDAASGSFNIVIPALSETFKAGELYWVCSVDYQNGGVSSSTPTLGNVYYNSGSTTDGLYEGDYSPGGVPGTETINWGTNGGTHSAVGMSILPPSGGVQTLPLTGAGR